MNMDDDQYTNNGYRNSTSTESVIAIILAFLSFLFCTCNYVFSIPAIILARSALRKNRTDTVAKVALWIARIVIILITLFYIVIIGASFIDGMLSGL